MNSTNMYDLSQICKVKPGTKWAEVNLDLHATKDYGDRRMRENPLLNPEVCARWVNGIARSLGVDYTYGGYMEDRSVLWRGHYMDSQHAIHFGIDVNVPIGTDIYCPVPFMVVEMFRDEDNNGGWGDRVIVKTKKDYVIFAHLLIDDEIRLGQHYDNCQKLGYVAHPSSNGGWFPHLHLQGLKDMSLLKKLDGYGCERDGTRDRYPNPLDILLVP